MNTVSVGLKLWSLERIMAYYETIFIKPLKIILKDWANSTIITLSTYIFISVPYFR